MIFYLILFLFTTTLLNTTQGKVSQMDEISDEQQEISTTKQLPTELTVSTLYGDETVKDPLIIELLHHKAMMRLKKIDQHGPIHYFKQSPTFSRYDHAIGIYFLLKRHGFSRTAQIAGLLHNASHTVFSHVADSFFKTESNRSYHHDIHLWHLETVGIGEILKNYNIDLDEINPDLVPGIKSSTSSLSINHLDSCLRTSLLLGRLTQAQIDIVIENLSYESGLWSFATEEAATLVGIESAYLTQHFWGTAENIALNYWTTQILRQLSARELITSDLLHFGTDQEILDIMNKSTDHHIQKYRSYLKNAVESYVIATNQQHFDYFEHPKCRVINPQIRQGDGALALLTTISPSFEKEYAMTRKYCQTGIRLSFSNLTKQAI